MQRAGLRARYQKGCRHALYSAKCGVVKADQAVSANLIGQSGFELTVELEQDSVAGSIQDSTNDTDLTRFAGGIVELSDGTMRFVLSVSGSTLTLLSPFSTIDVDSIEIPVTLFPGCAHNVTDCRDKFDNLLNYGGFPFIPEKNPFSNSVTGSIA